MQQNKDKEIKVAKPGEKWAVDKEVYSRILLMKLCAAIAFLKATL